MNTWLEMGGGFVHSLTKFLAWFVNVGIETGHAYLDREYQIK